MPSSHDEGIAICITPLINNLCKYHGCKYCNVPLGTCYNVSICNISYVFDGG